VIISTHQKPINTVGNKKEKNGSVCLNEKHTKTIGNTKSVGKE